jgi:hypothetical protein
MTGQERYDLAKAAVEYGESFNENALMEANRIDAFIAGAEWSSKQQVPGAQQASQPVNHGSSQPSEPYNPGPMVSGLPCDFDINNPDRVKPLNTEI